MYQPSIYLSLIIFVITKFINMRELKENYISIIAHIHNLDLEIINFTANNNEPLHCANQF